MPAIPLDVLVAAQDALDRTAHDPRATPEIGFRCANAAGRLGCYVKAIIAAQAVEVAAPQPSLPRGCEAAYTLSATGTRFSCARHCSNGADSCKARHEGPVAQTTNQEKS